MHVKNTTFATCNFYAHSFRKTDLRCTNAYYENENHVKQV